MKKNKFTIILPVAKGNKYTESLNAIKKLNYPETKIEVIIVTGNQPSIQRNSAAEKAKGDILYFLDNDSLPGKENLNIINRSLNKKNTVVIGGPSLSRKNDSNLQKIEAIALGSFIGSAKSKSRYSQTGHARKSDETELILCNMAIKCDTFIKMKGFNPKLYPNEENELLNRIKNKKGIILYHPELVVFRSHRKTLFKFIKQIFTYGRGRGDQVIISLKHLTLFPVISSGFIIYLLSLLFYNPICYLLPGILYSIIILIASIIKTIKSKIINTVFILPLLYFIIHLFYGVGFICGLFKSIFKIKKSNKKFWFNLKWIKKI